MTDDDILQFIEARGVVTIRDVWMRFGMGKETGRSRMSHLYGAGKLRKVSANTGNKAAGYAVADGKPATPRGITLPTPPWEGELDVSRYEVTA